jgi:hypothetical protein
MARWLEGNIRNYIAAGKRIGCGSDQHTIFLFVDSKKVWNTIPEVVYTYCTGNVLDLSSRFDQRIIATFLLLF